ncbi:MAG: hypothetical protein IJS26_04660 [Alphaproteobacteria bacterium]|nr:hypothetical protein [Alphaproteobacteria bacterium]
MGIFKSHKTESDLNATSNGFRMGENQTHTQTEGDSNEKEHSGASKAEKNACGCGCTHQTKPLDEEVIEVKEEEWDY